MKGGMAEKHLKNRDADRPNLKRESKEMRERTGKGKMSVRNSDEVDNSFVCQA